MNEREVLERMTWDKFEALIEQWRARRALLRHEVARPAQSFGNEWVMWRCQQTLLALELSKAEAALIALEDAQS